MLHGAIKVDRFGMESGWGPTLWFFQSTSFFGRVEMPERWGGGFNLMWVFPSMDNLLILRPHKLFKMCSSIHHSNKLLLVTCQS